MSEPSQPGRAYTLAEIDRMRTAVARIETPVGQSFYPNEVVARIEEHLRTYLAAGVLPEALEEKMSETVRAQQEMQQRMR